LVDDDFPLDSNFASSAKLPMNLRVHSGLAHSSPTLDTLFNLNPAFHGPDKSTVES
jgi:hypothetical protein